MFLDRYAQGCCFLSDAFGNPVCPHAHGSISYTELSAPGSRALSPRLIAGQRLQWETEAAVLIEGYVTVAGTAGCGKETIPFRSIEVVRLPFTPQGALSFTTECFACRTMPPRSFGGLRSAYSEILVQIDARACDCGPVRCAPLQACIALFSGRGAMRADVYQYNAIAGERQRVFTDADELTQYGSDGIASPAEVTLSKVFANGMLQPPENYDLQKGMLRFQTEDLPAAGAAVSVYAVRLKGCSMYHALTNYFVAVADGVKTVFTDADALKEYSDGVIPSPGEVTFFNLFVNGVLQPSPVYVMRKGSLELTEAPGDGQYVILESVIVRDSR